MQLVAVNFSQLLFQVPLYIVWFVGAVLCIVNWRKHSTVSLLALIAFVLFFLAAFIGDLMGITLPLILRANISLLATLLTIRAIVQMFVNLVAWVLILVAIFGWRSEPAKVKTEEK
jgi:hypothetical protein